MDIVISLAAVVLSAIIGYITARVFDKRRTVDVFVQADLSLAEDFKALKGYVHVSTHGHAGVFPAESLEAPRIAELTIRNTGRLIVKTSDAKPVLAVTGAHEQFEIIFEGTRVKVATIVETSDDVSVGGGGLGNQDRARIQLAHFPPKAFIRIRVVADGPAGPITVRPNCDLARPPRVIRSESDGKKRRGVLLRDASTIILILAFIVLYVMSFRDDYQPLDTALASAALIVASGTAVALILDSGLRLTDRLTNWIDRVIRRASS